MSAGSDSSDGEFDEQAAFDRLVEDNYALLRSDVRGQSDEVLALAARILAEGTRRRISGRGNAYDDEEDLRTLRSLIWPEEGTAESGSSAVVLT